MRKWKVIGLVGAIFLAVAISNRISRTSSAPPPDIATMKEREEALDDECRGGPGDLPETRKACDDRDRVLTQLKAAGVCWGDPNNPDQIGAYKTWQRCDEPAPRKEEPEPAFAQSEPEANDDIQYDPAAAQRNQLIRNAISSTRSCMRAQTQTVLRIGVRNRQEVVDWLSAVCSRPLNFNRQLSVEETAQTLRQLAYESIGDVELEGAK